MTRAAREWKAENWADSLPAKLGLEEGPVDLFAIARSRQVKKVSLRFIVPRGALGPIEGGFEIYLRHPERGDMDISATEPAEALTSRQRFTLAHEIVHTLFYRAASRIPEALPSKVNARQLEDICNRTASYVLIPTLFLERAIGNPERIDSDLVVATARHFRTSITVLLERLSHVFPSSSSECCVLLARRVNGDAQIRAVYFATGLLRLLPRARRYSMVTEWLRSFPRDQIASMKSGEWTISRSGHTVVFSKRELSGSGDFLLYVRSEPVPVKAPNPSSDVRTQASPA